MFQPHHRVDMDRTGAYSSSTQKLASAQSYHNGKPNAMITKVSISPKSKYMLTYRQEIKLFELWSIKNKNNSPIKVISVTSYDDVRDFKISDKKVILYEANYDAKVNFFSLKNQIKITNKIYERFEYKYTNILKNGNFVSFSKPLVATYKPSNIRTKSVYVFKEEVNYGGVTNDKMWLTSFDSIFIMDLHTFQFQMVPLFEMNLNPKQIDFKFSENLLNEFIMKVNDTYHIYSNNVPVGKITDTDARQFDFAGSNDELMITLSSGNTINIYFWKSNLEKSINFIELFGSEDQFKLIEFRGKKAFGICNEEPKIIDISEDLKDHIVNDNMNNSIINEDNEDMNLFSENLLMDLNQNLNVPIQDESDFFKNYLTSYLMNRETTGYIFELIEESQDKMILNVKVDNEEFTSCLQHVESLEWNYQKINNTYIAHNEKELFIYTFNLRSKEFRTHRYDLRFLKYAIKHYNNRILDYSDIADIVDPSDDENKIDQLFGNNESKKQWISYLLNSKYYFALYGGKLLKSAIKKNNIDLLGKIFNKTIETFEEDPKSNIYILSIICNNISCLSYKYSDFISRYYNDVSLITHFSKPKIIYNEGVEHLHSFSMESNITKLPHKKFLKSSFDYESIPMINVLVPIAPILMVLGCLFYYRMGVSDVTALAALSFFNLIPLLMQFACILSRIFIKVKEKYNRPKILFLIQYPYYVSYPPDYNWFIEIFWPQSSPFIKANDIELYKTWNGESLINFKWTVFGRWYYAFWSSLSLFLGLFQLLFEIRQFIMGPNKCFQNIWNWFDLGVYLLPSYITILWLMDKDNEHIPYLVSIACLILDIKFILFLQVFESFGVYFAIIKEPKEQFGIENLGDLKDSNNPWRLTEKYHQISEGPDGKFISNFTLYKEPDERTNLFTNYLGSLFAMYLLLTGNNPLGAWSLEENILLTILMVLFSFIVVIFLMNLFIGLLNKAIDADDDRVHYIAQKAEASRVLKKIELFYLLPHQRRWKSWFPDIAFYHADVYKTRQAVRKSIADKT
ncbi:4270_t:CDS:10 [Funneliformis mosseae]|uniref:4270_t:CDS:1 n=1 Tax=Funneliformis mosseae TaxID=27381 RepID=A0A9N9HET9_FUNMO|nr:4270_t:CDS:10 [Funneliformis mosseae]